MDKPRNSGLARRLESYRLDYEQVTGKPFEHFFCPILGVDEPAELIRGHVINRAFRDAPRAWVIQRSDVDNFYGSHFRIRLRVAPIPGPTNTRLHAHRQDTRQEAETEYPD